MVCIPVGKEKFQHQINREWEQNRLAEVCSHQRGETIQSVPSTNVHKAPISGSRPKPSFDLSVASDVASREIFADELQIE
jgi:hypothetical protein